jgi:pimeloyl-ACP methyl ester carboxylesterase
VKNLAVISTVLGGSWYSLGLLTAFGLIYLAVVIPSVQAQNASAKKPVIVMVHGAYADGSSWNKVIPLLQARGYTVVSVQNPLSSLKDDVAATNRVINLQTDPVVLVGHSWAGVVITEAGNNPKVKALVYVSGAAPDGGQSLVDAAAGFPPSPAAGTEIKDEAGFLTLPASSISKYFAQDLTPAEQGIVTATQGPWYVGCVTDKVTKAAWHDKPSWWVIGENDHMVNPKMQEKMAVNIKAKLTKLPTGHLAMLADPKAVTNVILDAANSVQAMKASVETAPTNSDTAVNNVSYNQVVSQLQERDTKIPTARDILGAPGVVPLSKEQPPAKIIADPPVAEWLAEGRVVIQYRAENLRIVPVFGPAALAVTPRIGHIHVTVDDTLWRWADASGEPLIINKLPPGAHKVLIELVNANHQPIDRTVVRFVVPNR